MLNKLRAKWAEAKRNGFQQMHNAKKHHGRFEDCRLDPCDYYHDRK